MSNNPNSAATSNNTSLGNLPPGIAPTPAPPSALGSNFMLFKPAPHNVNRGRGFGGGPQRGGGTARVGRSDLTDHDRAANISRGNLGQLSSSNIAGSSNRTAAATPTPAAGPSQQHSAVNRASSSSSDSDTNVRPLHRRRSILHIRGGGGCGIHNFTRKGGNYKERMPMEKDRDVKDTREREPFGRGGGARPLRDGDRGHPRSSSARRAIGRKRSRTPVGRGGYNGRHASHSRNRRVSLDARRGRRGNCSKSRSNSRRGTSRDRYNDERGLSMGGVSDHDTVSQRRAISRVRSLTPARPESNLVNRLPSPIPLRRLADEDAGLDSANTRDAKGGEEATVAAPDIAGQKPKVYSDSFSPDARSPSSRHRAKSPYIGGYSDEGEGEMRYPRFDGGLPRRRGAVPFLSLLRMDPKPHSHEREAVGPRQRLIPLLPPSSRRKPMVVAAPSDPDGLPSLPIMPNANTQLVAYGEYIVHKVLGKGIGSIVVQVSRVDDAEGGAGGDGAEMLGTVIEDGGATIPQTQTAENDNANAAANVGGASAEEANKKSGAPSSAFNISDARRDKRGTSSLKVMTSGQQRIIKVPTVPRLYALKLFRGWSTYDKAADEEATAIATVLRRSHCPYLMPAIERIEHPSHSALLFPLCGPSLLDVLEGNRTRGLSRGLPHATVKSVLYQLISCVKDLHGAGVIHTDIKPENVLFRSTESLMMSFEIPASSSKGYVKKSVPDPSGALLPNGAPKMITIKEPLPQGSVGAPTVKTVRVPVSSSVYVIDLGNAVYIKDLILRDEAMGTRQRVSRTFIQTRHYRAPEVLFDAGWDHSSDMWSIGCIITELLTGDCLFPMHNDAEHVALMEKALGPIPAAQYGKTKVAREFCTQYQINGNGIQITMPHSPVPEGAGTGVTQPVSANSTVNNPSSSSAVVSPTSLCPSTSALNPSLPAYLRLRSSYVRQLSKHAMRAIERQRTVRRLIEKNVPGEEGKRLADLAEALLQYDPVRRITAADACNHSYFSQLW